MRRMIPQKTSGSPIGGRTEYECKVYPNGEAVVWRPRRVKIAMPKPKRSDFEKGRHQALVSLYFQCPEVLRAGGVLLGLSLLPNFDRLLEPVPQAASGGDTKPLVDGDVLLSKGRNGITSFGARMVRNGAHLIERSGGRHRTVFSTCTVPDLPIEQMSVIHQNWNKVVEIYRLGLRRALEAKGLSGESVTVSEVQEKRYERTGIPVLHIHSVFIGKTASGQWAITTEHHDRLWRSALQVASGVEIEAISAACNLQRVKKSAEGYIGKYMTKGAKSVSAMVERGFSGWVPKQWWNMSRSLRRRIDVETRTPHDLACWLYEAAEEEGSKVWDYHRDVLLEMDCGRTLIVARYGRLSIRTMAQVQEYYSSA